MHPRGEKIEKAARRRNRPARNSRGDVSQQRRRPFVRSFVRSTTISWRFVTMPIKVDTLEGSLLLSPGDRQKWPRRLVERSRDLRYRRERSGITRLLSKDTMARSICTVRIIILTYRADRIQFASRSSKYTNFLEQLSAISEPRFAWLGRRLFIAESCRILSHIIIGM